MTLPELSAANLVEIKDDAGWSLSVNFGRGDKARDAMRAFSDAIRTGQLVERDGVAGEYICKCGLRVEPHRCPDTKGEF